MAPSAFTSSKLVVKLPSTLPATTHAREGSATHSVASRAYRYRASSFVALQPHPESRETLTKSKKPASTLPPRRTAIAGSPT